MCMAAWARSDRHLVAVSPCGILNMDTGQKPREASHVRRLLHHLSGMRRRIQIDHRQGRQEDSLPGVRRAFQGHGQVDSAAEKGQGGRQGRQAGPGACAGTAASPSAAAPSGCNGNGLGRRRGRGQQPLWHDRSQGGGTLSELRQRTAVREGHHLRYLRLQPADAAKSA